MCARDDRPVTRRRLRSLLVAGALAACLLAIVPPARASDRSVTAKFLTTITVFNRDRHALGTSSNSPVSIVAMRTHMIVRRAILGADGVSSSRARAGRSLALQGLNEIIDALAIDLRIADGDPASSIEGYASHWTTGVQLLHAAGRQLGVFR